MLTALHGFTETDAPQPRKGCLAKMFKGGAAVALVVAAVAVVWYLKYGSPF